MSRILELGVDDYIDFSGAGEVSVPSMMEIGAITFFEDTIISSITEPRKLQGADITTKTMPLGLTLFCGATAITITSGSGRAFLRKIL